MTLTTLAIVLGCVLAASALAVVAARKLAAIGVIGQATVAGIAALGAGLTASELAIESVSRFWQDRPLTSGLVVGALTLAGTILLLDEVISRRERRRWEELSKHAADQMADMAIGARIGVSNLFHDHPMTRAAQQIAGRRAYERVGDADDDYAFEAELRPLLLPLLMILRDDPTWRRRAQSLFAEIATAADAVVARWSVVSIGEEQLAAPTDALVGLVRRLMEISWCLDILDTASRLGWDDRGVDRYRIASDALPELLVRLHLAALIARRACDKVLATYGVARLIDNQIAEQVGIPGSHMS